MARRSRRQSLRARTPYLVALIVAAGGGLVALKQPFLVLPDFPPALPAPGRLLEFTQPPEALFFTDFEDGARLAVLFGALVLGAVLGGVRRQALWIAVAAATTAGALLLLRIRDLEDTATPVREFAGWLVPMVGLSPGPGLHLAAGAAGVGLLAALLGLVHRR